MAVPVTRLEVLPSPGRATGKRRAQPSAAIAEALLRSGRELRDVLSALRFGPPVACVYNPLEYAWAPYERYIRLYGNRPRRIVFLGMNPGPFGMVQTGVPFGEIHSVRDWLRVEAAVEQPAKAHPKRPILGFACDRSEISGKRLWGLFASRFGSPVRFFREHFVMNYCPLAFMGATGRNLTPDKLAPRERERIEAACGEHLRRVMEVLKPEWLIGIGGFAAQRAAEIVEGNTTRIGQILHPSPACPAANRDWAGVVERQLKELGVWKDSEE